MLPKLLVGNIPEDQQLRYFRIVIFALSNRRKLQQKIYPEKVIFSFDIKYFITEAVNLKEYGP